MCVVGDLVEDVVATTRVGVGMAATRSDHAVTVTRHRGGSAANVAAAVAVGGRGSGARARFVGRVGSDALGASLSASLAATGAEVWAERGGRTGTIVVLVHEDGERSFLTDRGASLDFDGVEGRTHDDLLADVDWLHLPWYSLHRGPIAATCRELLTHAGAIPFSIDASSTALLGDGGEFLAFVAHHRPEVVFSNEDEARVLGIDLGGPGARGAALTVVKRGPAGGVALRAGLDPISAPAPEMAVVDTIGAGDAFAAGFLLDWWSHRDAASALSAGHRLGAEVVGAAGADGWIGERMRVGGDRT